jgi:receptor protein-tyrosine kinase
MSRVHDALRRAENSGVLLPPPSQPLPRPAPGGAAAAAMAAGTSGSNNTTALLDPSPLSGLIEQIEEIDFDPAAEAHLIDPARPKEGPLEEFRMLRTRLNHLQSLQPLHTVVVTSASPAEGKSFTATNFALVQSHLDANFTLLCDFDFRRPIVHNLFKFERSPGLTDYLQGKASLPEVIKRLRGTNLFLMSAGSPVVNPLELLNLREVKVLLERLPSVFNWVVIDSPPMLFAADANLLATMTDATLLVVRLGQTTIDSLNRALQGMSRNNVIGIVANAAKRGELYSKYSYYRNYYYSDDKERKSEEKGISEEDLDKLAAQNLDEDKDPRD